MWAVVSVFIFLVVLSLFGVQNMHQTRVNFPMVGGLEIQTVFLLMIVFILGFMAGCFFWFMNLSKNRGKR
ncbi:MAG: hypothetical protein HQL11_04700 [Candidatus Omnitrophica bacterium]|nr:hypothetical protein [Candidatus Omnitrophota bacterium]